MSENRNWQSERWLLAYHDDRQGNATPFAKALPYGSYIVTTETLPKMIPEMFASDDDLEKIAAACIAKLKQRAGGDVRSVSLR